MSQGKTRQVPELLKYCGADFPTATSGSQTFDCPVIKIFFDGIKFASFETVLSGWMTPLLLIFESRFLFSVLRCRLPTLSSFRKVPYFSSTRSISSGSFQIYLSPKPLKI